MNYSKIEQCDVVNGAGVRTTLFVSGCSHACAGCHNKPTWNYKAGLEFTNETLAYLLDCVDSEWVNGLTLSGGDPLAEKNRKEVANIVKAFRDRFGDTKDIWCWTGYTLVELVSQHDVVLSYLLSEIDVLVDGRYVQELKDPSLQWRGSKNQEVIYLRKT